MRKSELLEIAKKSKLQGYSKLRKGKLLALLFEQEAFQYVLRNHNDFDFDSSFFYKFVQTVFENMKEVAFSLYMRDSFIHHLKNNHLLDENLHFVALINTRISRKLDDDAYEAVLELAYYADHVQELGFEFLDILRIFKGENYSRGALCISTWSFLEGTSFYFSRLADWLDFTQKWGSSRPELFYDYIEGKL